MSPPSLMVPDADTATMRRNMRIRKVSSKLAYDSGLLMESPAARKALKTVVTNGSPVPLKDSYYDIDTPRESPQDSHGCKSEEKTPPVAAKPLSMAAKSDLKGKKLLEAADHFSNRKSLKQFWKEVNLKGADPRFLIGRGCMIFWPLDSAWYPGVIYSYNSETQKFKVQYEGDENEWLLLSAERVKLNLKGDESVPLLAEEAMDSCSTAADTAAENGSTAETVPAAQSEAFPAAANKMLPHKHGYERGDVVWCKLRGFPHWPALVLGFQNDENLPSSAQNLSLQFFATFDSTCQLAKSCVAFEDGIKLSYFTKSKQGSFLKSVDEAERYLRWNILPDQMMEAFKADNFEEDIIPVLEEEEDKSHAEEDEKAVPEYILPSVPWKLGPLTVECLGTVAKDSPKFHSHNHIWPVGYTSYRMYASARDPTKQVPHKMEVLRKGSNPIFRVTPGDDRPVDRSTPQKCWEEIHNRVIRSRKNGPSLPTKLPPFKIRSGPFQFGFSVPEVSRAIQALPGVEACTNFQNWDSTVARASGRVCAFAVPEGYVPLHYSWQHGDRCSVCYHAEEYDENQLLQCDSCRTMVHMDCYTVKDCPDGDLWLCQPCSVLAPRKDPPCCLCPVRGGAMKMTSDGRWAHVSCALWIPETTLRVSGTIHGVEAISQDRRKLRCSLCKIRHGACIQCANRKCMVAYHPLCARYEGLVMKMKEVNPEALKWHQRGVGSIQGNMQLLSFCQKHGCPEAAGDAADKQKSSSERSGQKAGDSTHSSSGTWQCPVNPSGSARSEPYNWSVRRGRREPEAAVASIAKRNFVESIPYIVSGRRKPSWKLPTINAAKTMWLYSWQRKTGKRKLEEPEEDLPEAKRTYIEGGEEAEGEITAMLPGETGCHGLGAEDKSPDVCSMSDRFRKMQGTVHARLSFGKSSIHGWGLFTNSRHYAGDMVIEYAGEVVRPIIADIREKRCYDKLVGAGTYMFRIDDGRVVDATHSGTMAHLINHSCEPNCYSRVVTAGREDHIVIFAKRDIRKGEELTYDYRFSSDDETLPCNCGTKSCRGIVNLIEEGERAKVPFEEAVLVEDLPLGKP